MYDVQHNGGTLVQVTAEEARELGASDAAIGAAKKASALATVAKMANGYRARLASPSAGKHSEYRIKEEIARDPASATETELALIEREAAARGMTRDELLAQISALSVAYRQAALLVGVLEAETKTTISAIADDAPDLDAQISAVLGAAVAQADEAFGQAAAQIASG